jgi:hypothetical protein
MTDKDLPPKKAIGELKITDIDFPEVERETNPKYAQRYCELIEEDGCHYEELYKRCKEKLLKLSPKL